MEQFRCEVDKFGYCKGKPQASYCNKYLSLPKPAYRNCPKYMSLTEHYEGVELPPGVTAYKGRIPRAPKMKDYEHKGGKL